MHDTFLTHRMDPMTQAPYSQPIKILLVEDTPDDAALTVETLQEGKLLSTDNGELVLSLQNESKFLKDQLDSNKVLIEQISAL